jgi:hypothetical protein
LLYYFAIILSICKIITRIYLSFFFFFHRIVLKKTAAAEAEWNPSQLLSSAFGENSNLTSAMFAPQGRGRGGGGGGGSGHGGSTLPPPGGFQCYRCGKKGHNMRYCPTIGDPKFDPEFKLMNVPRASRKKVNNLAGVDITNKMVSNRIKIGRKKSNSLIVLFCFWMSLWHMTASCRSIFYRFHSLVQIQTSFIEHNKERVKEREQNEKNKNNNQIKKGK